MSPTYAPSPYWWDDLPLAEPDRATVALPVRAEVVVVGAGYTGLSAARALAGLGRQVLVLDRGEAGGEASGRNGGMVQAGTHHDAASLLALPGGRDRWEETVRAFEDVEHLARALPATMWQRCGHLELATHRRHLARLRRAAEALVSLGERARVVEGDELAAEIGSSAFCGGMVVERSGALQPAALAVALAQAARQAGADVRAGVAVRAVEATGGGGGGPGATTVRTDAGEVVATEVVVATGATTGSLLGHLGRRLLPVGSFMIATEPVSPELARTVSPRGRTFFDVRNLLHYWRLSPDATRVLFGGRSSLGPITLAQARDRLWSAMVRIHPQLRGVRVERAWGGAVDLSMDREPHIGRDPRTGAWYAAGYSGTGIALSVHLGAVLARWMSGKGEAPAFAHGGRPWRPVPAAARLPGALAVAGWWYRGRDALGR